MGKTQLSELNAAIPGSLQKEFIFDETVLETLFSILGDSELVIEEILGTDFFL